MMREKDGSKSIVRGISFNHKLMVWDPMVKDWSTGESLFQRLESRAAFVVKVPQSTLLGESG